MKKKMLSTILSVLFVIGIFYNCVFAEAASQSTADTIGIQYPISLATGKDASGNLIFPDADFIAYIKQETFRGGQYQGMPFDLDANGELSQKECDAVRVLELNGRKEVDSIEGIAAFPKLRELRVGKTGVQKINLSHNPKLQKLSAYSSDLRDLDISKCPLLSELDVHDSRLACLDTSHNPMLQSVIADCQVIDAGEYQEGEWYKVDLKDLHLKIDLSNISEVKIDGAVGDGINSGYDAEKGIVYCSDEIREITYCYDTGFAGSRLEDGNPVMEITLKLALGFRQSYDVAGGTNVLAQYIRNGQKDKQPRQPERDGYRFTGWYTQKETAPASRWTFGTVLTENMTLYAGWEKKSYKVFYDVDGGSMTATEKTDLVDWWSVDLLPTEVPTKDGFILTGWKTETGQMVTESSAASLTYGEASGDSVCDATTLTAQWEALEGYQLSFSTCFSDARRDQVKYMPEQKTGNGLFWDSRELIWEDEEPELPGYEFIGWYTDPRGDFQVTEKTTYAEVYRSQFQGTQVNQIPTLYARFEKKRFTIYYDERGGSKVADRTGVLWGSKNLLPATKTKKKHYIFAGWKCNGRKVTKKTRISSLCDGSEDAVILTAFWYPKYEKKGKIFVRYGCRYKVVQSNKKGNRVRLVRVSGKKAVIWDRVFYNGKMFKVTSIKKGILKKKKVILRVVKKKKKKYQKMIHKAGGK